LYFYTKEAVVVNGALQLRQWAPDVKTASKLQLLDVGLVRWLHDAKFAVRNPVKLTA
jgi:hypothetical protein